MHIFHHKDLIFIQCHQTESCLTFFFLVRQELDSIQFWEKDMQAFGQNSYKCFKNFKLLLDTYLKEYTFIVFEKSSDRF